MRLAATKRRSSKRFTSSIPNRRIKPSVETTFTFSKSAGRLARRRIIASNTV